MSPGARIDYKVLREINPEAARQAVSAATCGLEYLKANKLYQRLLKSYSSREA